MKVDTDRMDGGQELLEEYRKGRSGGIPWFVFLDAEGREIITSTGPDGGMPERRCPNRPRSWTVVWGPGSTMRIT